MRQFRRVILPLFLVLASGVAACGNLAPLAFRIALWVGEAAVESVVAQGLESLFDKFFSQGNDSVQPSDYNPLVGVATQDWMVSIGAQHSSGTGPLQIRIPAHYVTFVRSSRFDGWELSQEARTLVEDRVRTGRVQVALQLQGYEPGDVDGIWGRRTTRAMKAFQDAKGLSPTGQLDASTQQALHL